MTSRPRDEPPPHAAPEAGGGAAGAAPARGVVFLTDPSAEAERAAQALRASAYVVLDVPLALLPSRAAVQRPDVVLVDAEADGAREAVARLRALPGGQGVDIIFLGPLGPGDDDLLFEASGAFGRPLDVSLVVRKIQALLPLDLPPLDEAPAPPPSPSVARARGERPPSLPPAAPPPSPAGPARPDGDAPPQPRGSSLPSGGARPSPAPAGGARGARGPTGPQLSDDLRRLLDDAEQRLAGAALESVPAPEDEVDAVLPPELLEALDEPLDVDEHDEGATPAAGTDPDARGPATFTEGARAPTDRNDTDSAPAPAPPSSPPRRAPAPAAPRADRGALADRDREVPRSRRSGDVANDWRRHAVTLRPPGPRPYEGAGIEGGPRGSGTPSLTGLGDADGPLTPLSGLPGGLLRPGPVAPTFDVVRAPDPSGSGRVGPLPHPPGGRGAPLPSGSGPVTPPPAGGGRLPAASGSGRLSPPAPPGGGDRLSEAAGSGRLPPPSPGGSGRIPTASGSGRGPLSGRDEGAFGVPGGRPSDEPAEVDARGDSNALEAFGPGDAARALGRAVAERQSFALCFEDEGVLRRVVLRDGDFVTAGSGAEDETLVAFLASLGDLPREPAQRLKGRVAPFGRHAGAALVARGHVAQDRLWAVLRGHAEWLIGRVVTMPRGQYAVEPEPPRRYQAEPSVFGGSAGAEVFVDVVRRVVDPAEAVERLGGPRARIADGPHRALGAECALSPREQALCEAARGAHVGELVGRAGGPEFAPLLWALALLGVVEAHEVPTAPAPGPNERDAFDELALRERVRARLELVEEGDYFAMLGVPRSATSYDLRRAYLDLRRSFEPSHLLADATADLAEPLALIRDVLDEAYDILRDPTRRERYRRAIEGGPPSGARFLERPSPAPT